jgi:nickel-dependent lactate racemase
MKSFQLKFGDTYQNVAIDENSYQIDVVSPPLTEPSQITPEEIIKEQFRHPINSIDFPSAENNPNLKIAIAINDKTRPVPHEILLPSLINFLNEKGVCSNQIKFYIATGTHEPMPQAEFSKVVPARIADQFEIVSHDCDKQDNLTFLGHTSRQTPVWVNSEYYAAQVKIVVGCIEPHHFMGFSGGNKSASIGLTGRETINTNHAMITSPYAVIGCYEQNPMRQDIEEIGDMIGVTYALNVILNTNREIVHALFGSPREVMLEGVKRCRLINQTEVSIEYDLVIASAGGYPKDINFYQSQKAMTHAAQIVKTGGTVILCAECREGSGSAAFEELMDGTSDYQDGMAKFLAKPFKIGPHKAYQIATLLKKMDFYMITSLSPALAGRLHLTCSENIQPVFNQISSHLAPGAKIAILPNAINTIPTVQPAKIDPG